MGIGGGTTATAATCSTGRSRTPGSCSPSASCPNSRNPWDHTRNRRTPPAIRTTSHRFPGPQAQQGGPADRGAGRRGRAADLGEPPCPRRPMRGARRGDGSNRAGRPVRAGGRQRVVRPTAIAQAAQDAAARRRAPRPRAAPGSPRRCSSVGSLVPICRRQNPHRSRQLSAASSPRF